MKHLETEVKGLFRRSLNGKRTIEFYNAFGSKLSFGGSSIECLSEEPLQRTEELYQEMKNILSIEITKLNEEFILQKVAESKTRNLD